MKRLIVLGLAGLLSIPAMSCPLTDWLTQRYGVSFSGFEHAIPESRTPPLDGPALTRIAFPDASHVSDGFRHAVVLDAATGKAWILRTGGFASVYQWYGPVDVPAMPTDTCRIEPATKSFAHKKGDPRSPST
jgi:hypothetical protein